MNRTRLGHGFAMVAGLAMAAFAAPAAAIGLDGSADDRNSFIDLINSFSTGGKWSQEEGAGNAFFVRFTADGKELDYFAKKINQFNNGASISLTLGRNQPGVLVGAYLGRGRQELDLSDIAMFSSDITFKPRGDFQQALLLHELGEAYTGDNVNVTYADAHKAAIGFENAQIEALGALGRRQLTKDVFVPGNLLTGFRPLVRMPWVYQDPAGDINGWVSIKVGNGNVLNESFIRGGLVDLEAEFNPATHEDVWIESVDFEPEIVPAPGAALLLLAAGCSTRRRVGR
jgi:hypothetical protein